MRNTQSFTNTSTSSSSNSAFANAKVNHFASPFVYRFDDYHVVIEHFGTMDVLGAPGDLLVEALRLILLFSWEAASGHHSIEILQLPQTLQF